MYDTLTVTAEGCSESHLMWHVCRYSVFVGASLLVTIITLSAALLRALQQVCRLAACSEAEGTCLYDVQRFVYKRLVRTFAKMDAETLELQATGLCRAFSTGNSSSIDPLDRGLQTNLITAEVRSMLLCVYGCCLNQSMSAVDLLC